MDSGIAGAVGRTTGKESGPNSAPLARPVLTGSLTESLPAALVLLRGPAGYSKTTSLKAWDAADRRPFAWLTCRRRHGDPAVLIGELVRSLESAVGKIDDSVLRSLASTDEATGRLCEAVAGIDRDFVLVLDDVHLVSEPAALEVISGLIASVPDGSQVAVATRSTDDLPVARLRSAGELFELGPADLALSLGESGELLRRMGLRLERESVARLHDLAEGWPAVTYLAALVLRGEEDPDLAVRALSAEESYIFDYLSDELFAGLDPEIRRFLVRTSILDALSGELCDELMVRSGSVGVLRDLAATNHLVIPLERTGREYRYHHLLGDYLRRRFAGLPVDEQRDLRIRAAGWFRRHGDYASAVEHGLASGDLELAGEIMWDAVPEVLSRGHRATLERWLAPVPPSEIESMPGLLLCSVHLNLVQGNGHAAVSQTETLRRLLAERSGSGSPELGASGKRGKEAHDHEADLVVLDATLAPQGPARMAADAERALDLLPFGDPFRVACSFYSGVARFLLGDAGAARPRLEEAVRRGSAQAPLIQVLALAQLVIATLEEESADEACSYAGHARSQMDLCGLGDYPVTALVWAASALARARSGELTRAPVDLARAQAMLPGLKGFPAWYGAEVRLSICETEILLDRHEGAVEGLVAAEDAMRIFGVSPVLSDWLARCRQDSHDAVSAGRTGSLTPAEMRTLRFLPSHLSFRSIGDRLHLSPNTIKTQARSIYRKLDVDSREAAVERARSTGLLRAGDSGPPE